MDIVPLTLAQYRNILWQCFRTGHVNPENTARIDFASETRRDILNARDGRRI